MEREQLYTYIDKICQYLNRCRDILDYMRFSGKVELTDKQLTLCNTAFTKICEALDQIA